MYSLFLEKYAHIAHKAKTLSGCLEFFSILNIIVLGSVSDHLLLFKEGL